MFTSVSEDAEQVGKDDENPMESNLEDLTTGKYEYFVFKVIEVMFCEKKKCNHFLSVIIF